MKLIKLYKKKIDDHIEGLRTHNRDAQQKVYDLIAPKMLSVCRQYVKDIHFAEDIMIAGFMKVFTQIEQYEGNGSFEGWIRRIMVNEAISFLRKQKDIKYIEEIVLYEEPRDVEFDLSMEDLELLIDGLPDGCKMVFNLFVVEGYKHLEIAKMLQIQEGTSKSQLAQARKLLQIQLEQLKLRGVWNGAK